TRSWRNRFCGDQHPSGSRDRVGANQKTWLGSDYMQKAFSQNGDHMIKRLGDGFYEQRLIRAQVVALTGQRYLDGYSND
ncbi:hypothetical protein O5559_27800, partial [Escherichia coli]|nr:hypothetical protein [Escherichia coli]